MIPWNVRVTRIFIGTGILWRLLQFFHGVCSQHLEVPHTSPLICLVLHSVSFHSTSYNCLLLDQYSLMYCNCCPLEREISALIFKKQERRFFSLFFKFIMLEEKFKVNKVHLNLFKSHHVRRIQVSNKVLTGIKVICIFLFLGFLKVWESNMTNMNKNTVLLNGNGT